jgi:primosomal protein N' (replication factor Y)
MIVQVAGRAGRAEKRGKVILQTRHPEHALLTTLVDQGYNGFAETALAERREASLPPYSYQVLLRAEAADNVRPLKFLKAVRLIAEQLNIGRTSIMGPVSAPMARRAGRVGFQFLFQNNGRPALHALFDVLIPEIERMKSSKSVRWSLDVDPMDLY